MIKRMLEDYPADYQPAAEYNFLIIDIIIITLNVKIICTNNKCEKIFNVGEKKSKSTQI